jgi:hypothetical protein
VDGSEVPFATRKIEKSLYVDIDLPGPPAGAIIVEYR